MKARALVLNMTHHSGLHGCLYCETQGKTVPFGGGYPSKEDIFCSRTDESVKQNVEMLPRT